MPEHDDRYADPVTIGRGGMGTVARALDRVLLRPVAVKTIASGLPEEAREQFVAEAQITGQLDHPNIVPVHDLGMDGSGACFYTMKLVGGQTLAQVIVELHAGGLASAGLERVVRILGRVSEAVAFAHSRGVVHRDLKPANIMIGSHGQVYVMDWGLALLGTAPGIAGSEVPAIRTLAGITRPRDGGKAGTASYMAPEQAHGRLEAIDGRTDVFALGAILYEVLTGWPPYAAERVEEVLELARRVEIVPPQEAVRASALPPGLCEIAMKAMSADPARRHPSAEAFGAELEDFLRGGGWFATRTFAAGEVIVREGEEADSAYVLARGHCQVYQSRDGRDVAIRKLGPGDVFGETAILSARPRTATVVALEDVAVKVVTPEAFERELGQRSWVGVLVKQLADRFLDLEQRSPV